MSQLPFPRAILSQHSATLGKTGAGKSSALRVSVEDLLAQKKRVVIIDPKGDWWGLKSSADGKGPGFPIITFGDFKEPYGRGDVPINERSGTHVAELIASGNRPCVIGFRGWMPGHMMQFWIGQGSDPHRADGFLPTLFNKNEGELYVFVDEVQNFAAKGKILSPQAGLCVHWTNKAMSESRGMGMTFHIASQRSQKVHNDTLDCCETLIGMRTAHPAARKSIEDWINSKGDPVLGKEVLGTLAELKRGEAWVWSPENEFGPKRVQFPMFQTFDSFAPPQLQKKVNQSGWSEIDLDQVREKLSAVIAEAKANDPRELKTQIAQLRKELAAKVSANPAPIVKADEKHDSRIAERAAKAATAPLLKHLHKFQKLVSQAQDNIIYISRNLAEIASADLPPEVTPVPVSTSIAGPGAGPREPIHTVRQAPAVRPAVPKNGNANGDLSGPERKILTALAELRSIGKGTPPKTMVAAWSSYSPQGGAFGNPMGALSSKGYVEYPQPGFVLLTEAGRAAIGDAEPPDQDEIWRRIERTCTGPERKILRALIDNAGQNEIAKTELAEKAGYSPVGGAFGNPIGALRTKGLLDYPRQGMVRAAEWLFI